MPHKLFDHELHITSGYKTPERPNHIGIDLRAATGSPLYACEDGFIRFEGYDSTGAIVVEIQTHDSIYQYGHLSRTIVNKNQQVKAGDLIGYSGATGNVTGPHLHFELMTLSRVRVDPTEYVYYIFKPTPTPPTPQPPMNEFYTLKHQTAQFNTVSHVVAELIDQGIWPGPLYDGQGNQSLRRFEALNPVTPAGGYKNGDSVRIIESINPEPAAPVISQEELGRQQEENRQQLLDDEANRLVNELNQAKARIETLEAEVADMVDPQEYETLQAQSQEMQKELETVENQAEGKVKSSDKKPWQSKKFWVAIFSVVATLVSQYASQDQITSVLELLEVLSPMIPGSVYIAIQGSIDKQNDKVDN